MKHKWTTSFSGREKTCEHCGAVQRRFTLYGDKNAKGFRPVTGYRWGPPAGRCGTPT